MRVVAVDRGVLEEWGVGGAEAGVEVGEENDEPAAHFANEHLCSSFD